MTEIGWYNQTTKGNRHCPFCGSNLIKDKVHFLFQCPTYSMTRSKFYYKVKTLIPNITQLPIIGLINELMNSIRANKSILSRSHYPDYGSWFYFIGKMKLPKKETVHPAGTHPHLILSISIRVSNPWIMCRTGASTGPQVMRITGEATDVGSATSRGWGRGVAFPRCKIFDVVKADWCFDPFNDLFDADHPHVSLRELILKELFHCWKKRFKKPQKKDQVFSLYKFVHLLWFRHFLLL